MRSTGRLRVGDVELARVVDYEGVGLRGTEMFPALRDEMWRAEAHWLVPGFFDPASGCLRTSIHSWLVRTPRHTVLIDACIGNHKERPYDPRFHQRDEPWLDRLAAAGAHPKEVDFVMCTHLHADHVGWNTRLVDGRWVPTFLNARYLFTRAEFDRWDERRPDHVPGPSQRHVFGDSVLPVVESGQAVLVDDGHEVDGTLTVEATPGHTPGHAAIRLRAGGDEALFCGDVMHHPIQLPHPTLRSSFDDDPAVALQTRLRLLDEAADNGILLLPTHFAAPFYCRVQTRSAAPAYMPLW